MSLNNELLIGSILTVLFLGVIVILMPAKNQPAVIVTPVSTTPTSQATVTLAPSSSTFSLADVARHNSQKNCWIIISNNVYDVTDYLFSHPGGSLAIIPYCGKDATTAFLEMKKHDTQAQTILSTLLVGSI